LIGATAVDILYLLIPLSAALVLLVLALFAWSVHNGQFEDLDREGERIIEDDSDEVDDDQGRPPSAPK
jgi:cbb3-type cytochrome oxidase maturation protein